MKGWIEGLLERPYTLISFLALAIFLGFYGYHSIHRQLFPDSNRPQIAVVLQWPGAGAMEIVSNIAIPVEEELYTLDKVRRVFSRTIDEVSLVQVEFDYSKDIDAAASDVANALSKIAPKLPETMAKPQIHKITATTQPIMVIGVHGADLLTVRNLLEHQIKRELLQLPGVANVELFGGYQEEVIIQLDQAKVEGAGLTMGAIAQILARSDRDFALGTVELAQGRFLVKIPNKRERIETLAKIPIRPGLFLGDLGTIRYAHPPNRALYFGNGKPAIAMAIQREADADVLQTIQGVEEALQQIQARYPQLHFAITESQKETIQQSITNMFQSLRDAILMSTLVTFFFLASIRQMLVVLFTIPLVYGATITGMYLLGIEFNVVTLTAIILALGLLLDDAVVVMENIERHYRELGKPIEQAVVQGTREILFADLSGTITTMVALVPIMFVGDYPQTIFRPLVGTLLIALAASYLISITTVPLLSLKFLSLNTPWITKVEGHVARWSNAFNQGAQHFFQSLARAAMEDWRIATLYFAGLLALFLISVRLVMPLVGRELMPPMDTGIVKIEVQMDSNLPIEASAKTLQQITAILSEAAPLVRVSGAIGSEPGVMGIGSGQGIDTIAITATYVDRFQRSQSIWQIEAKIRQAIAKLPNIKYYTVFDYGATALSSIRGNIDLLLRAEEIEPLKEASDRVYQILLQTKGLTSVAKSWELDKEVWTLRIDEQKARWYGIDPAAIAAQLALHLKGRIIAAKPVPNAPQTPIRIQGLERIDPTLRITTPKGAIPLETVATIESTIEPSSITREGLAYTIDVYGFREKAAISHILANFHQLAGSLKLPPGVTMEHNGDIAQFEDSAKRMVRAILFGVVLIFLVLVPLFHSFKAPLLIILSIPLTIIGAAWILLLLDYHISMPAMMGFILLSGIIVNNAILLIEFALLHLAKGLSPQEAMLASIRVRTRPVLMTAFATTAGMLPVALGWAIGLERLAPLGAVAIGGLMVGTFLTLLFIPILFVWSYRKR
ncbi:MAG: AcrB/AcrD/AcrF family protein [Nitratiruptor sp.]|nr:AcrB/AcrD/AcrF family protein [Nitratiruptor sp.]NPA83109.1 efflux RND transporter permease subunit [Campylobacterota bacterium]